MRLLLCTLILLFFHCASASADESTAVIDIPPGEDRIVVLEQGAKAPFTGQLFDNDTAFRWGGWLLQYKYRLNADLELQKRLCDVDKTLLNRELAITGAAHEEFLKAYRLELQKQDEEIARLRDPPFFRTAWFGFTMGASVVVVGLAVGAVYLLR